MNYSSIHTREHRLADGRLCKEIRRKQMTIGGECKEVSLVVLENNQQSYFATCDMKMVEANSQLPRSVY